MIDFKTALEKELALVVASLNIENQRLRDKLASHSHQSISNTQTAQARVNQNWSSHGANNASLGALGSQYK